MMIQRKWRWLVFVMEAGFFQRLLSFSVCWIWGRGVWGWPLTCISLFPSSFEVCQPAIWTTLGSLPCLSCLYRTFTFFNPSPGLQDVSRPQLRLLPCVEGERVIFPLQRIDPRVPIFNVLFSVCECKFDIPCSLYNENLSKSAKVLSVVRGCLPPASANSPTLTNPLTNHFLSKVHILTLFIHYFLDFQQLKTVCRVFQFRPFSIQTIYLVNWQL